MIATFHVKLIVGIVQSKIRLKVKNLIEFIFKKKILVIYCNPESQVGSFNYHNGQIRHLFRAQQLTGQPKYTSYYK